MQGLPVVANATLSLGAGPHSTTPCGKQACCRQRAQQPAADTHTVSDLAGGTPTLPRPRKIVSPERLYNGVHACACGSQCSRLSRITGAHRC